MPQFTKINRPSWYTGIRRFDWKIIGSDSVGEGNAITLTIEGTEAPEGSNWPIVVKTLYGVADEKDFDRNVEIFVQPEFSDPMQKGFWRSTFTIQTKQDTVREANETFEVVLDQNTAGSRWTSKRISIIDDDTQMSDPIDWHIRADQPVGHDREGSSIRFEISRTSGIDQPGSILFGTYMSGSAKAGLDYTIIDQKITFEPGESKKSVFVQSFADNVNDGTEWFYGRIKTVSNNDISGNRIAKAYISNVSVDSPPGAEESSPEKGDQKEPAGEILDNSEAFNKQSFSTATWRETINVNRELTGHPGSGVLQAKQILKNSWNGPSGSVITGSSAKDVIRGLAGWDKLTGGDGDDLIHGGNGRDIIDGGSGADELHGDFGWNTYRDQRDGSVDLIAIKSDQKLSNWWYGKAGNNSDGRKADIIEGLDSFDQIKIIGVATTDLSFSDAVTHKGVTGVGIYANRILEALYTGGDLSVSQISSMTTGDSSAQAIANQVWSYWGDNTVPALLA